MRTRPGSGAASGSSRANSTRFFSSGSVVARRRPSMSTETPSSGPAGAPPWRATSSSTAWAPLEGASTRISMETRVASVANSSDTPEVQADMLRKSPGCHARTLPRALSWSGVNLIGRTHPPFSTVVSRALCSRSAARALMARFIWFPAVEVRFWPEHCTHAGHGGLCAGDGRSSRPFRRFAAPQPLRCGRWTFFSAIPSFCRPSAVVARKPGSLARRTSARYSPSRTGS